MAFLIRKKFFFPASSPFLFSFTQSEHSRNQTAYYNKDMFSAFFVGESKLLISTFGKAINY
jgi:hypothetical protein